MFVVFDLDGTLSDHRHRLHHVTGEKKDHDAYYDESFVDRPHLPIVIMLNELYLVCHHIEIWTGRPERMRIASSKWLLDQCIPGSVLMRMRPDGDFSPDTALKGQWLEACGADRPDLVFEDRPRMVQFWREQGIMCCDVGGAE